MIQLFGKSRRFLTPMMFGAGARKLFEDEPALKNDPRFKLYPDWMQAQVAQPTAVAPASTVRPATARW